MHVTYTQAHTAKLRLSLSPPRVIGADDGVLPRHIHTHISNSKVTVSITDKTKTAQEMGVQEGERAKGREWEVEHRPFACLLPPWPAGSSPHSPEPPVHFWVGQHSGGIAIPETLLPMLEEDPQALSQDGLCPPAHSLQLLPLWKGLPKVPLEG